MSEAEPQVSWKALEKDATVVTSDGDESARVAEIVGDPAADIFNGLVLNLGVLDKNRYLPAEHVTAIWPRRVEVDVSSDELNALPAYEEPVVERLEPDRGFFTRLRNLFRCAPPRGGAPGRAERARAGRPPPPAGAPAAAPASARRRP